MRPIRARSWWCLGVLAVLATSSPLFAQLSTATTVSGLFNGVAASCPDGTTFNVGVTVRCADVGPAAPGAIRAIARSDAGGRLRGTATARGAAIAGPTIATATASWTERVLYAPLTRAVRLRFGFGFSGFETSSGVTPGVGTPSASVNTFIRMGVSRDGGGLAAYDELLVRRTYDDFGTFQTRSTGTQFVRRGVDGPFRSEPGYPAPPGFDVLLDAGSTFADFTWNFALNATIAGGASGEVTGFYGNTASINGISLVDEATGADVSREFGLQFASGAVYGVPEPSAFPLMLVAFAPLLLAWRRHRHRRV